MTSPCGVEHLNGFVHMDVDFGGIEKRFHLAEKFDETGDYMPAWFVSVRSDSMETIAELRGGAPITLHYALPRELLMLVNAEVNTPSSNERLRNMALIYLQQDLLQLRRGQRPTNLDSTTPTWVDEAEAGRLWVVHTIYSIASEAGIDIKNTAWTPIEMRNGPWLLRVDLEKDLFEERFSYEDLCDCPGTPVIQRELESRLTASLVRYRPKPRKIGF